MRKELSLASGLLIGSTALAIGLAEIDNLINLEGVVVSANKIHVNRDNVPLSVSVIEWEEIEASSGSALLPVLSERVPGLFVTEKGTTGFGASEGAVGTVNIWGVGRDGKASMLFDGQPQWAGVSGHSLPDTYATLDMERVGVIRGPSTLLYDSNTMGDVVNIITRQHNQSGRHIQARIVRGSYNAQKYMINNGYSIGNSSSCISLNHDCVGRHRPDSKFHITNGSARLGYKVGDHYKATGDVSLAKFKSQNPGEITNPLIDNIMNILRSTTSSVLENNYEKTSGALRAFYNWGHRGIDDGYSPGGTPNPYLFYLDNRGTGFLLCQPFRLMRGNSFTVGIDYKSWSDNAWQDSINGNQNGLVNKTVNEIAGYVIVQQDLLDKVSLNVGVCYGHNGIFDDGWIPQADLMVRPFGGNVIKTSLSKDLRNLNIRKMYMFPPRNPDLKPERMMNYEVSIGQALLDGNLFTGLVALFIDGQDMIEATCIGERPKNVNMDILTNKDIEPNSRYQILKDLSLGMNCSYLRTSKALLTAPARESFANVVYALRRFTFNMNAQSIFNLYINTVDKMRKDYTILNVKVAYRFGTRDKGLSLFVKGENLAVTRYSINEGFPMSEAIFMGGIDVIL